jgi:hypothetical protein
MPMRTREMIGGAALIAAAAAAAVVLLLASGGGGGAGKRLPLAVFTRPQTAADRAAYAQARHGELKGFGGRAAPASLRVARTTPWGQRVFVLLDRDHDRRSDPANPNASFWLAWAGDVAGAPMSSAPGWTAYASSGGAYYPPPGVRAPVAISRFVVLVPNDVARVRFTYPDGGPSRTVPAIGNTVAVQFRRPCCVLTPEMTWFSSGGSVIGRHLLRPNTGRRIAPPSRS